MALDDDDAMTVDDGAVNVVSDEWRMLEATAKLSRSANTCDGTQLSIKANASATMLISRNDDAENK